MVTDNTETTSQETEEVVETTEQVEETTEATDETTEEVDGETAEVEETDGTTTEVSEETTEAAEETTEEVEMTEIEQLAFAVTGEKDSPIEKIKEKVVEQKEFIDRTIATNDDVVKLLETNPDLLGTMRDMKNGATFTEALVLNIKDIANLDKIEVDENKWGERIKAKETSRQKAKELKQTIKANREKSFEVVDGFVKERKYTDEHTKLIATKAEQILSDALDGVVTPEFLDMIDKSINYEKDLEAVKKAAKIEGANKVIAEKKVKRQTKKKDAIPSPKSKNVVTKKEVPVAKNWFDDVTSRRKNRISGLN